jgi:glutathione synthase/RimK-type ligase-like ATP-grasp enzyme
MQENNFTHIIIVDKHGIDITQSPDCLIISARDFIENTAGIDLRSNRHIKVINLCQNYDYLSKGYYCSLLAEARGMRCVPSVSNIVTLNWKRYYQASLPELNELLEKHFKEEPNEPLTRTYTIYFGRTENDIMELVARRLFDIFRFPLMTIEIKFTNQNKWQISSIEPLPLSEIPKVKFHVVKDALDKFTGSAWRDVRNIPEKYWIAILHDPKEEYPPSNEQALQKFMTVGKDMGLYIEFVQRHDYATILEYDALLIRETTAINHHTYRFALKAEMEGLPVIDDTQSIIHCCNKVYLHELLTSHNISVPPTIFLEKRSTQLTEPNLDYPFVLKIPDGSFSRGIVKVKNAQEFQKEAQKLFKKSEIILAQSFIESEYDWRVGILNGEPLYACKYYMAKDHWQIYNYAAPDKADTSGAHLTVPVHDIPPAILEASLNAARLIGDGLYGVDLKETKDGIYVIEVNDNPNIDHGIEDEFLGDELYRRILKHLVNKIEAR